MNKKEAKLDYKINPPPMGVFQIRNLTNEKILVGSSPNIDGIFNRRKFQLNAGNDPNKSLQADWNSLGGENFAFEILEEFEQRENLDSKMNWNF